MKITITDYRTANIGQSVYVQSRTDFGKLVNRKIYEKSINTIRANEYHVHLGFKIGKTIVYPLMQHLVHNNSFTPFSVDVELKLYVAVAERTSYYQDATIHEGDKVYQWIGEYKGMEVKGSRVFFADENLEPTWYINDAYGVLPKESRKLAK